MDVGLKLSGDVGVIYYDVVYYYQDDWGEDSIDIVDDNGYWGSSIIYCKIKIGVVNLDWIFLEYYIIGVFVQYGCMQDLVLVVVGNLFVSNDEGIYQVYDLYYMFEMNNWIVKYCFIDVECDFGGMDVLFVFGDVLVDEKIENQWYVVEVGYNYNNWFYYVDVGVVSIDIVGNEVDDV